MDTANLAQENALLKPRLAQVEAVLAEVQEANRRLEDMPHAQRNASSSASAVVSDECELVSVCPNPLRVRRHRAGATR